jgi:hypothetical protein
MNDIKVDLVSEAQRRADEERRFKITFILSVASLIITPFLSGLVVWWQLSREHSFAKQQEQIARHERLFEQKLKLIGDMNRDRSTNRILTHLLA